MKFTGKIKGFKPKGDMVEVLIEMPGYNMATIEELDKEKMYAIDITDINKKRSLNQNNKLWALITDICKKEDGNASDKENKYLNLLEMAGIKTNILSIEKVAIEDFKRYSKARKINVLDEFKSVTGKENAVIEVIYGSSTFNTAEMSQLINAALTYADEIGLNKGYWETLFKENNL